MKRIVFLCDGTWNSADAPEPTNVVRIAHLLSESDGPVTQIPVYIQGVGTGEGNMRLSRRLDRLLGGAFGWGLMDNVVEAYRHLVFLYEPGDEIFVFGFSRGAYTARSFVGFVRAMGILPRTALHLVPDAVARYRDHAAATKPGTAESAAYRLRIGSRVATDPDEVLWRHDNGHPDAPLLKVPYVGVWDTVGALGVPRHVPVLGRIAAAKYGFHDTYLSSMVDAARHAVAIDERRRSFEPTLWKDLDAMNEGRAGTPYRQLWFAGDHGSVGGGGDIRDLSSIALAWIAEGAADAGLAFDAPAMAALAGEHRPLGPLHNHSRPRRTLSDRLTRIGAADRTGPTAHTGLSPSALDRWDRDTSWRPGPLAHLGTQIAGHFEALRRVAANDPDDTSAPPRA